MKTRTFFLFAAVLFLSVACQKEMPNDVKGLTVVASIEQQESSTKTSFGGNSQIWWTAGDMIKVNTTTGNFDFTLSKGEGSASGSFSSADATGTPKYAIYPSSVFTKIDGSVITFNIPAVQNYVENNIASGVNIAVASYQDGNLDFKNVCGFLKLTLYGTEKVTKIEIKGNNSEKLNGSFTADASSSTPIIAPDGVLSEDNKIITLNCGVEGVQLSTEDSTNFFIAVPAGVFGDDDNGGFTAVVYAGTEKFKLATNNKENIINRSRVRVMPSSVASFLPSEYTQLKSIKGNSVLLNEKTGASTGPYINTGIAPNTVGRVEYLGTVYHEMTMSFGSGDSSTHVGLWSDVDGYLGFVWGAYRQGAGTHSILLPSDPDTILEFVFNKVGIWKDGVKLANYIDQSPTATTPTIDLFAGGSGLWRSSNSCTYFRLFDTNDVCLCRLVPAKNSEGTIGMYDTVTSTFFTNAGDGTFTCEEFNY